MNEFLAQPFSALSLMGITVPETAQTYCVAAGLGTLTLCWLAQLASAKSVPWSICSRSR